MTETQVAYLAGLIDARGCFNITQIKNRGRKATVIYHQGVLLFRTQEHALQEWLIAAGGKFYTCKGGAKQVKLQGTVTFTGPVLFDLINQVYPHLRVKSEKASLVRQLFSCSSSNTADGANLYAAFRMLSEDSNA